MGEQTTQNRTEKLIIYGRLSGLNEYTQSNRTNPYKGANLKAKNERLICAHINQQLNGRKPFGMAYVKFRWFEKNRRRDKDNVASAKKFVLDALVSKGILVNDNWKHLDGFSDEFYVDAQNPRVEVDILEVGM